MGLFNDESTYMYCSELLAEPLQLLPEKVKVAATIIEKNKSVPIQLFSENSYELVSKIGNKIEFFVPIEATVVNVGDIICIYFDGVKLTAIIDNIDPIWNMEEK